MVDQLRAERQGGSWTSDSGALSDYEGSESYSSLTTLCGEDTESSSEDKQTEKKRALACDDNVCEHRQEDSITSTQAEEEGDLACDDICEDRQEDRITDTSAVTVPTATPSSAEMSESSTAEERRASHQTCEKKAKEIGDILSKIKSLSPEELPPCSKREMQPSPGDSNSDVILVSDLEKELFSDSSEDTSPENLRRHEANQQEGHCKKLEYQPKRILEQETTDNSKWRKDSPQSAPNNSTYGIRHYNGRGSSHYRQRNSRGVHHGRERYRAKENGNAEWLQNGKADEEEATESGAHHRDGENNCNKPPSDNYKKARGGGGNSHQQSPLVHSHMWSGAMATTRRGNHVYGKHRHHHHGNEKQAAPHAFNHYEVGCFLMEGTWCDILVTVVHFAPYPLLLYY